MPIRFFFIALFILFAYAQPKAAAQIASANGVIESIDLSASAVIIDRNAGSPKSSLCRIVIDKDTMLVIDGKAGKIGSLAEGDKLTAVFDKATGVASKVQVTSRAALALQEKERLDKIAAKAEKDRLAKSGQISPDKAPPNVKTDDGRRLLHGAQASVVEAEGVGKDEMEAKRQAFRDAVSKVVGAIVDAQTLVKNDEIIKERILEFSGGFIKTYEVLKTDNIENGLVRVRIKATVERIQLVTKLADAKIATKEIKGADLLAERMTKEEARKNATELVAGMLEELPKMMKAEVMGKPRLNAKNDAVLVEVAISVDQKRYGEFIKTVLPKLDKIAITKQSMQIVATSGGTSGASLGKTGGGALLGKKGTPYADNSMPGLMGYDFKTASVFSLPKMDDKSPPGWALWIVTLMDGSHEKIRWDLYWIDSEIGKTLAPLVGKKRLQLTFTDADGGRVTDDELKFGVTNKSSQSILDRPSGWLLYGIYTRPYLVNREHRETTTVVVAPFAMSLGSSFSNIAGQATYLPTVTLERQIKLTDKELERVKTINAAVTLDTSADEKPGRKTLPKK